MRVALLADVHANLHALEAILPALERERPEAWIVAGDLVGYGPSPDECVARLLELDPVVVAGNHDLIALGRLSPERCVPLARASLAWTAASISAGTRAALEGLPPLAGTGPVVVAHGSLDDPQEYLRSPERAREELARLEERHPSARVLVVGHTHRPMAVSSRGDAALDVVGVRELDPAARHLLNPGSVGQSRSRRPAARAALLDLDEGRVRFVSADYDVRACAQALHEKGLDPASCHMPPAPFPGAYRLRRIARRVLRRPPAG